MHVLLVRHLCYILAAMNHMTLLHLRYFWDGINAGYGKRCVMSCREIFNCETARKTVGNIDMLIIIMCLHLSVSTGSNVYLFNLIRGVHSHNYLTCNV